MTLRERTREAVVSMIVLVEAHARQIKRANDVETAARTIRRLMRARWKRQKNILIRDNRLRELPMREAVSPEIESMVLDALFPQAASRALSGLVMAEEIEAYNGALRTVIRRSGYSLLDQPAFRRVKSQLENLIDSKQMTLFEERWINLHSFERLARDIDHTTRERLRVAVGEAYASGSNYTELVSTIRETFAGFTDKRANLIAETELNTAYNNGGMAFARELGAKTKVWNPLGSNVCPTCRANQAQGIIPIGDVFVGGTGAPTQHPGCLAGGAVVTALGVAAQSSRWHEGEVCVLGIPGREDLTVTLNHPIFTRRGWISAGTLQDGDEVLQCLLPCNAVSQWSGHQHYVETTIDKIGNALTVAGGAAARVVKVSSEAFHGDAIPDQEVSIVFANRELAYRRVQLREDELFRCGHCGQVGMPVGGAREEELFGLVGSPDGRVGGFRILEALLGGEIGISGEHHSRSESGSHLGIGGSGSGLSHLGAKCAVTQQVGFSGGAQRESHLVPSEDESPVACAGSEADRHHCFSGSVAFVKLTKVERRMFSGHVFNLETCSGIYLANSIVTHNCLCVLDFGFLDPA